MHSLSRWGLLLAAISLGGCGGGAAAPKMPDTVPFKGTVKLDGNPLADATIVFTPVTGNGAVSMGRTDSGGAYNLNVVVGSASKPGAVPGDYKVHVSTMLPPPPSDKKPAKKDGIAATVEKVPQQFAAQAITPLRANVPSGGGSKDFELTSK